MGVGKRMPDYEKMYHDLFNAITDALDVLEDGAVLQAKLTLILAQQKAEEAYISAEDR